MAIFDLSVNMFAFLSCRRERRQSVDIGRTVRLQISPGRTQQIVRHP